MSPISKLFLGFTAIICSSFLLLSCNNSDRRKDMVSVEEKLASQLETHTSLDSQHTISFLTAFASSEEAMNHIKDIQKLGGKAHLLKYSEVLVKSTINKQSLPELFVPEQTVVSLNSIIKTSAPRMETYPQGATETLTARQITGVEDLLARFPEANGQGQKVAVIDTGIEFGVQGISDLAEGQRKLVGFYDLTEFGMVELTKLQDTEVRTEYNIDGERLKVSSALGIKTISGTGKLSEKDLTNSYLASDLVDINRNKKSDTYLFVMGINNHGDTAIWIDADLNGMIDSAEREELTDFNTTYRYINLRPEVSPSGAHPLAVTIHNSGKVQFHNAVHSHGTACAAIIAGKGYANGHLNGMAPEAQLLSYTIDALGEDIYTMDQLLAMFLHAKEQGANAISVSWHFSTADITSARFISEFLDKHIASAGITIGIAAGNQGPGIASGASTDYMPHYGFSIGAYISQTQAQNVYGWTGIANNGMIYYSNRGPTKGGRLTPDLVSPLMTLVRGNTVSEEALFFGFGGTSSATPAFIGSITALRSALVAHGHTTIDSQVFKLALLGSAQKLTNEDPMAQGAGLVNVNLAYDLYLKLIKEKQDASHDSSKASTFPLDLRAQIHLPQRPYSTEGIHLSEYTESATVTVFATPESLEQIDQLTQLIPLTIEHDGSFVETPAVLAWQAVTSATNSFTITFKRNALQEAGVYTDVIRLKRPSDGLTLLHIPVVVEIPHTLSTGHNIAFKPLTLSATGVWRKPITLNKSSSIHFNGLILNSKGTRNGTLQFAIKSRLGQAVWHGAVAMNNLTNQIELTSSELPQGSYELVIFQSYGRPAVLADIEVLGSINLAPVSLVEAKITEHQLSLLLSSQISEMVDSATVTINRRVQEVALTKQSLGDKTAYLGSASLLADNNKIALSLHQPNFERLTESFQNVSLAIIDLNSKESLYRGWVDFKDRHFPGQFIPLRHAAKDLSFIAYPNIIQWDRVGTDNVFLRITEALSTPLTLTMEEAADSVTNPTFFSLGFELDEATSALLTTYNVEGSVVLQDKKGRTIATVPLRLTK